MRKPLPLLAAFLVALLAVFGSVRPSVAQLAGPIVLKHGNQSTIPTLAVGEPGVTVDTLRLWIGTSGGNKDFTGSRWFYGSGTPSSVLGYTSDVYLDTVAGALYQKGGSGWGSPVWTTPALPSGSTNDTLRFSGSSPPAVVSDSFLRNSGSEVTVGPTGDHMSLVTPSVSGGNAPEIDFISSTVTKLQIGYDRSRSGGRSAILSNGAGMCLFPSGKISIGTDDTTFSANELQVDQASSLVYIIHALTVGGDITGSGYIQGAFKSTDGSAGLTITTAGATFKNGILTSGSISGGGGGGSGLTDINSLTGPSLTIGSSDGTVTITSSGTNIDLSAGGTGAFDPSTISGLVCWLDASALTGLSDGDPVSSWTDESSGGTNSFTASGSVRPTYHTNRCNSLPGIVFGGSHYLQGPGLTVPTSNFTFLVVFRIASGGQSGRLFGEDNISSGTDGFGNYQTNLSSLVIRNGGSTYDVGNAAPPGNGQALIYTVRMGTDPATTWWVNSSIVGNSGGKAWTVPSGISRMAIGNAGSLNAGFSGDIYEVLVYNHALTSYQIGRIQAYEEAKWGI